MRFVFYCLSFIWLGHCPAATAQVRWGLRAGVNSSTAATELVPVSSYTPLPGWQAGIVAEIPLSEVVCLQPALVFATKGFVRSSFFEDNYNPPAQPYGNAALRLETLKPYYLKIPVLATFKATFTQGVKLYVGIGPYFGSLLGGTVLYDYKGVYSKGTLSPTRNSFFDKSDAGLSGTTGIELMNHFQLGIIYDYGIINVAKDKRLYDLRNRTVNLSLTAFL